MGWWVDWERKRKKRRRRKKEKQWEGKKNVKEIL